MEVLDKVKTLFNVTQTDSLITVNDVNAFYKPVDFKNMIDDINTYARQLRDVGQLRKETKSIQIDKQGKPSPVGKWEGVWYNYSGEMLIRALKIMRLSNDFCIIFKALDEKKYKDKKVTAIVFSSSSITNYADDIYYTNNLLTHSVTSVFDSWLANSPTQILVVVNADTHDALLVDGNYLVQFNTHTTSAADMQGMLIILNKLNIRLSALLVNQDDNPNGLINEELQIQDVEHAVNRANTIMQHDSTGMLELARTFATDEFELDKLYTSSFRHMEWEAKADAIHSGLPYRLLAGKIGNECCKARTYDLGDDALNLLRVQTPFCTFPLLRLSEAVPMSDDYEDALRVYGELTCINGEGREWQKYSNRIRKAIKGILQVSFDGVSTTRTFVFLHDGFVSYILAVHAASDFDKVREELARFFNV